MKICIYLSLLLLPFSVFSQEETTFLIYFKNVQAADAIITLERTFNVKISYQNQFIDNKIITLPKKKRTLKEVLNELSILLQVKFKMINQRYIVVNEMADENEIEYYLQQLDEIVINEYLTKGIAKNRNATFKIQPKQLDILPGLIEADVLESIQELPGVISPNETATGLNVRGGTQDQNQIIWDGINMYHNGHLFGMISSFNPNITQSITFYNKGTNPRFGDRISSVIDISTSNTIAEKAAIGFGFNGVSADAYIETPIIKNKLSLLLAYRNSYENFFETGTFQKIEQKVFQNSSILDNETSEEEFFFKDYNLKLNYQLNKNNTLLASLIHIDNDLQHDYNNINEDGYFQEFLVSKNNGYSLSWNKNWNDAVKQTTTLSYSFYKLDYNFISGENQTQLLKFEKENQIKDYNLLTELTLLHKQKNHVSLGYQASYKKVNYDFMETTDLSYILDKKDVALNTHSVFSNFSGRHSKWFDFELGIRVNYYNQLNTFRLEPRILLIKNLNNYFKIQISGEIKNQIIYKIDETIFSDISLENKLWILADGNEAPIINSKHGSLGFMYHNNGWTFDMDTYYKKIKGISALSLGFFNENNTKYFTGKQNIYGVDFYTKKDFNNIKTWVSFSINKTDNKFEGINNNNYFTASNEIAQHVSASITYKIKQFQVALGWKWHSGKPFTKTIINLDDNSVGFIGVNTERLPNYHRLDLSSVYNFSFSKPSNIKGKIGFSIWNLYNRKNFISREFKGNNTTNDPIQIVDFYSLNVLPNFIFRMIW